MVEGKVWWFNLHVMAYETGGSPSEPQGSPGRKSVGI